MRLANQRQLLLRAFSVDEGPHWCTLIHDGGTGIHRLRVQGEPVHGFTLNPCQETG
jgi:hypothetical protein